MKCTLRTASVLLFCHNVLRNFPVCSPSVRVNMKVLFTDNWQSLRINRECMLVSIHVLCMVKY